MSGTAQGPASPLPVPAGAGAAQVPEWVHLLPLGNVTGRDGRRFTVNDPAGIITASMLHSASNVLPFDYDHQIDLAPKGGGQAPAAGWITSLQTRADGIWGRVEWTPLARQRIAAREYRFVSPALLTTPQGDVRMVLRASLTNNPNISQLTSLNAAGNPMDMEQMLASLRELLALPATADAQAVMQAVRDMVTSKNSADPARFVPIELFQKACAEAQKANLGLTLHQAERVVDDAIRDRKLFAWMRDWGVQLCSTNAPAFQNFIGGVGPAVHGALAQLGMPAFPEQKWKGDPEANGRTDEIAEKLGLTAEDIRKYGK